MLMWIAITGSSALAAPGDFVEPDAQVLWQVAGTPGTSFGWAVSALGDLDGDGADEVLTGAPFEGGGTAVVLSGATGAPLLSWAGQGAEQLGYALADAGDVDGDGLHDIVVGAPGVGAGYARVFSGADGAELWTFPGDTAGQRTGASVASAGDVDGDGLDDVVVGAEGTDGADPGRVFVVSGADGSLLRVEVGEAGGDHTGSALAPIADVDGDGIGDHVVGARDAGPSRRGRVEVRSGADGTRLLGPLGGGPTDVDLGYFFVGGLGDVDGDSIPDVYGGDFGSGVAGANSGAAYVWSGADGTVVHTFAGSGPGEGLGCGRDGGDIDGDGVPDVAIGSWTSSEGAVRAGKIQVFSGADGSELRSFTSVTPFEALGFDTVGVGDVDGDGHGELVGSAASADRVYLLRGRGPDLPCVRRLQATARTRGDCR